MDDLDNTLNNYFKKIFKNVVYISPKEYMFLIGFQSISEFTENEINVGDPSGFCLAWCFWYLEMRLKNPNLNTTKLINKSISNIINSKYSFTEYIRNYANTLFQVILNYFNLIKLNQKYIYNRNLNTDIKKLIYDKILVPEINKYIIK